MSLGETAELRIEAEWAYGRKGLEGKYPFATVHVAGCGYCFFLFCFSSISKVKISLDCVLNFLVSAFFKQISCNE